MAYITTKEVAEIRKALKAKYGKQFKFGVRRMHGTSVTISFLEGDVDFTDVAADGYSQLNHYYPENYGKHAQLVKDVVAIIKSAPANAEGGEAWFDKSDSQSDYFHTAFYFDVQIGRWDKPYAMRAAK